MTGRPGPSGGGGGGREQVDVSLSRGSDEEQEDAFVDDDLGLLPRRGTAGGPGISDDLAGFGLRVAVPPSPPERPPGTGTGSGSGSGRRQGRSGSGSGRSRSRRARAPSADGSAGLGLPVVSDVERGARVPSLTGNPLRDVPSILAFVGRFITRNGNLIHKTPVPPPSDVAELEYVSALHQCSSMSGLRMDCSIRAEEISVYLRSRHGLCVEPALVRSAVLRDGLAAGGDGPRSPGKPGMLDLVELTAALLIPNLLRIRQRRSHDVRFREEDGGGGGEGARPPSVGSASSGEAGSSPPHRTFQSRPSQARRQSSTAPPSGPKTPRGQWHEVDNVKILRDLLRLITEDITGDPTPKPLTEGLVRDILRGYGEDDLAEDAGLVREMVDVASCSLMPPFAGEDGGGGPLGAAGAGSGAGATGLLDLDAFVAALTSDVCRAYDSTRESRRTTNFQDVWMADRRSAGGAGVGGSAAKSTWGRWGSSQNGSFESGNPSDEETAASTSDAGWARKAYIRMDTLPEALNLRKRPNGMGSVENEDGSLVIRRSVTGEAFDLFADMYRSRAWVCVLWFAFIMFYLAFSLTIPLVPSYASYHCEIEGLFETVVCPLVSGIVKQFLNVVQLIIYGIPFICLGSVGNTIEARESLEWIVFCITVFLAFNLIFSLPEFTIPWTLSTDKGVAGRYLAWFDDFTFVAAMVVVALQIVHVAMVIIRPTLTTRQLKKSRYWTFGNSTYEYKIKQSALFKLDKMLSNAHDVHRDVIRSKRSKAGTAVSDNTLSNYGLALAEFSKRDGIFKYIGGIGWTWRRILSGDLFSQDGIWISSRMVTGTFALILLIIAIPVAAYVGLPLVAAQFNPDEDEKLGLGVRISWGACVVVAFLNVVLLTILFLPTVVATIFKFRRGVIGTLRSEDFLHRYRFALDQSTLLVPGMFFGALFSSTAFGLLVGAFLYSMFWKKTQIVVFTIIGNLLGLVIVFCFKIIVVQCIRFTHYKAFYRSSPLRANVINVFLECYGFAISFWFIMVRTVKIVLIGALYLGRVDTPLFSPGVGIFGPFELDNWPTVTRKEILIHEAHRHPYIETLGFLYMMQLRHREQGFAKRANSAWRMVFVVALMPWLHKYRATARQRDGRSGQNRQRSMDLTAAIDNSKHGLAQDMDDSASISSLMFSQWAMGSSSRAEEEPPSDAARKAELRHEIARVQREVSRLQEELEDLSPPSPPTPRR